MINTVDFFLSVYELNHIVYECNGYAITMQIFLHLRPM